MTEDKKPPPKLSDFKDLLRKLMQVPKEELDRAEAERVREPAPRRRSAKAG